MQVMKKEAQIILLPTDKASNLTLGKDFNLYHSTLPIHLHKNDKEKNQFYYILSDSNIQEGDWICCLSEIDSTVLNWDIRQCIGQYKSTDNCKNDKKIIATNDLQLGCSNDSISHLFPQLSQQGLELLCKLYNEKKELKVMVDYEEIHHPTVISGGLKQIGDFGGKGLTIHEG